MDPALPVLVPEALAQARQALSAGKIIAYPTETLWGLGVDPFNEKAVAALLALKGRPDGKGLILLVEGQDAARPLLSGLSPLARRLMDHFWPGALTLVLPAAGHLPASLTGGSGCIALRHSPSPWVAALLAHWKKPLVSTSANVSGGAPINSPQGIENLWGGQVTVMFGDSMVATAALPSTVVRVEGARARCLREGAVPWAAIQGILAGRHPRDS